MSKKLLPIIIVAGLLTFVIIPPASSADLRGELDALDTVSNRWKTDSVIIKSLIFITAIMGALIAALQQSPSHRVKICSQTFSIFITVITSANFFFYGFDYKTLDYWVTKIEGRKAEIRLQYSRHVGDNGKFSDEQIAKKFHDDLMEFLKLINSAQERVMNYEKIAFNQSIVSLAFAEDIKPSWINNPPKDDTKYTYGVGISFGPDLNQTIQNAKNISRQKIGEKVLKNVSDTLKQQPLSIDKADNLPVVVENNVEKESTFKEFFVKKNEGYEVFVLGIYHRSNEMIIEISILAEEEKRFRLGVSRVQDLRSLGEAARKAKESMNKQIGSGD